MSLTDWLLALHLLSGFLAVGAITMFSIGFLTVRWIETPNQAVAIARALMPAQIAVTVGMLGLIVFGVWLAIALDAYRVWDLWVLLAIVGWAIASELGRRGGNAMEQGFARARTLVADGAGAADVPDAELQAILRSPMPARLHWLSTAITLLVLLDMIWKPGA